MDNTYHSGVCLEFELGFRDLMIDIALDFINVPNEKAAQQVAAVLKKIGEYLKVDRTFFCGIAKGYPPVCQMWEWCAEDTRPAWGDPGSIPPFLIRWWALQGKNNNLVLCDELEGLKADEKIKAFLQAKGTKSLLVLILQKEGKTVGFLGLESVKAVKSWPKESDRLFAKAKNLFLSAFEKIRLNKVLGEERDLLSVTLNSIKDGVIAVNNLTGKIVMFNKAAEKITGWKREDVLGKEYRQVLTLFNAAGRLFPLSLEGQSPGKSAKQKNQHYKLKVQDGSEKYISLNLFPVRTNHYNGTVLAFEDITETKQAEEEIRYLSYYDKLTGLCNRATFEKQLSDLDRAGKLPISIILADCNGLKIVNDAFGHDEGDRMLVKTAIVLQKACRKNDIVARIGGDEFAVILPGVDSDKAYGVYTRIKESCAGEKGMVLMPSLAMGIATKTYEDEDIHEVVKRAEDRMYSAKLSENKSMRSSILLSLRKTLEERTHETEAHASRLRYLSYELGKRMGLNDSLLTDLALLAHLHDIGKIATPDSILNKQGKLTEAEWEIMKKHSEAGYRIAASSPELAFVADFILSHHERWDGKGYPEKLKRYQIPLQSRIIAVVDAYDAMTNPRVYRDVMTKEEALAELEHCAGSQFDPAIVHEFVEMMREMDQPGIHQAKNGGVV